MTTKLLLKSASVASSAGVNVSDVFNVTLYDGTAATNTINTGINFSANGGLAWFKQRTGNNAHDLYDTERGNTKELNANSGVNQSTETGLTSFNNDGVTLSSSANQNSSGLPYVLFSFKQAANFFDIQTWTGDGVNPTQPFVISHNLGTTPGFVAVKKISGGGSQSWMCAMRDPVGSGTVPSIYTSLSGQFGWDSNSHVDNQMSSTDYAKWTSTQIDLYRTIGASGTDTNRGYNISGAEYVAYFFAQGGDGGFGADGTEEVIKVGRYIGNGSNEQFIDTGFEPQYLMIKKLTGGTNDWFIFNAMSGLTSTILDDDYLVTNSASGENFANDSIGHVAVRAKGFSVNNQSELNENSPSDYMYIAIARDPNRNVTSASQVFAINTKAATNPNFVSNFPVDMAFSRDVADGTSVGGITKLSGRQLQRSFIRTNGNSQHDLYQNAQHFDYMNGYGDGVGSTDADLHAFMWRRATGYFDLLTYNGTGSNALINHNLEAPPEMMWIRSRANADDWVVFHKDLGTGKYLFLNSSVAEQTTNASAIWNNITPTSTVFGVGTDNKVNNVSRHYLALLWATKAGISKVGSYTGDGSTSGKTIDCGFQNGAKFILIKAYGDNSNDMHFYVFDSVRGITNGNDPWIELDTDVAEQTVGVAVKPDSSGFQVVHTSTSGAATVNVVNETYIFYAVAA